MKAIEKEVFEHQATTSSHNSNSNNDNNDNSNDSSDDSNRTANILTLTNYAHTQLNILAYKLFFRYVHFFRSLLQLSLFLPSPSTFSLFSLHSLPLFHAVSLFLCASHLFSFCLGITHDGLIWKGIGVVEVGEQKRGEREEQKDRERSREMRKTSFFVASLVKEKSTTPFYCLVCIEYFLFLIYFNYFLIILIFFYFFLLICFTFFFCRFVSKTLILVTPEEEELYAQVRSAMHELKKAVAKNIQHNVWRQV